MHSTLVDTVMSHWDAIEQAQQALMRSRQESIAFAKEHNQPMRPFDQGDAHAQKRFEAANLALTKTSLSTIDAALDAIQSLLLPFPILNAQRMKLQLLMDVPLLSVGPWGYYMLHIHSTAEMRQHLEALVTLAQQDGTAIGTRHKLNLASDKTIVANNPTIAKSLFALHAESTLCYAPTGKTEPKIQAFSLPMAGPLTIPPTLFANLWKSLDALRALGVKNGAVFLFQQPSGQQATTNGFTFTPGLIKKAGNPLDRAFVAPPFLQQAFDDVQHAVTDLYAFVRTSAPVLKSLDAWAPQAPTRHHLDSLHSLDFFKWTPKAQAFQILDGAGGGQWGGPHPVLLCNSARFEYTLSRALGMLATLKPSPNSAWLQPGWSSQVMPGETLQDATLFAACLASGNKPGFVPGATVNPSDFGRGSWREGDWIQVKPF